jgi:DNA-binding transcriptional LysR family regulator
MDADALETFAAIVRTGNFRRAAAELGTVQSNVTRRIRLLESELGVALFERHARGVRLTRAGEQLLPYADRVAGLVLEARHAALGRVAAAPAARVRLGLPETLLAFGLTALAGDDKPKLEIGSPSSLIEMTRSLAIDAAIVAGPLHDWELTAEPLLAEELVLVTAADATALHALTAGKLLVFPEGCPYRSRLEAIVASRNLRDVRWMELGTLDGMLALIAAGAGSTLLPRRVVAAGAAAGRVALHALRADEATIEYVLVRRRDAAPSAALARVIAKVAAQT